MITIPPHVDVIAVDFESTGLKTWLPDFRIVSCAAAWPTDTGYQFAYAEGEEDVRTMLESCLGKTLIIQNVTYEMACIMSRYPDLWETMKSGVTWIDCARLVQNWDGGGPDYDDGFSAFGEKPKKNPNTGFRLEALAARVLPEKYHNHKRPYMEWIRANIPGVKKKQEGAYLSKLPADMLQRYNELDTEITYEVYRVMCAKFADLGFDWRLDHRLYISCCMNVAFAQNDGLLVDRPTLKANIATVQGEIDGIKDVFITKFAEPIGQVQFILKEKVRSSLKSEKGRAAVDTDPKKIAKWQFKVSSTAHLKYLFVDVLGMTYTFVTPKGGPSFKAAFLNQWGEGGVMLEKRGKRQLVLNQMIALHNMSEEDGRWHIFMKVLGTRTSRLAGGST